MPPLSPEQQGSQDQRGRRSKRLPPSKNPTTPSQGPVPDVHTSIAATIPIHIGPIIGPLDALDITSEVEGEQDERPLGRLSSRITLFKNVASVQKSTPEAVVPVKRSWLSFFRLVGRRAAPILDVGSSIAEAVPIFGAPVKGALDAFVKVQKAIEQHCQNQEDIEKLTQELEALKLHLANGGNAENDGWLVKRLEGVGKEICQLAEENALEYETVAEAINQCKTDIVFFLSQASVTGHGETQALLAKGHQHIETELAAVQTQLAQHQEAVARNTERQREQMAELDSRLAAFAAVLETPQKGLAMAVLTVVDPFGLRHTFSHIPSTYSEFGRMVLEKGSRNPKMQRILTRLVNDTLFELSIDNGIQVIPLGKQELSSLGGDASVVMSAVVFSVRRKGRVKCPMCRNLIQVRDRNADLVLCGTCHDGNVQASTEDESSDGSRMQWQSPTSAEELASLYHIVIKPEDRILAVHCPVDGDDYGSMDCFFGGSGPEGSAPTYVTIQGYTDDQGPSSTTISGDSWVETCNVFNRVGGDYKGAMEHYGKIGTYNCYNTIRGDLSGSIVYDGGIGTYNYFTSVDGDLTGVLEERPRSVVGSDGSNHTRIQGEFKGTLKSTSRGPQIPTGESTPTLSQDVTAPDDWEVTTTQIFRQVTGDCGSASQYFGNVRKFNVYNFVGGDFQGAIRHNHDHTQGRSYQRGRRGPRPYPKSKSHSDGESSDGDDDGWGGVYEIYNTIAGDFEGVVRHFGDVETFNVYNVISGNFDGALRHNHIWNDPSNGHRDPYQNHAPHGVPMMPGSPPTQRQPPYRDRNPFRVPPSTPPPATASFSPPRYGHSPRPSASQASTQHDGYPTPYSKPPVRGSHRPPRATAGTDSNSPVLPSWMDEGNPAQEPRYF